MLFEAMRIDEIKKMKFKDLALGHSNTNRGQEKRRISKETDKKKPPVMQEENQERLMSWKPSEESILKMGITNIPIEIFHLFQKGCIT